MKIVKFKNLDKLSKCTADFIVNMAAGCIKTKGYFTISLCGGSSPRKLFNILTSENIDWNKVYIFWGDERFVDINDDNSNYKMTYDILLSKIDIPEENIFITPVNESTPEKTASEYEKSILDFFTKHQKLDSCKTPIFDLIMLGAGNDGHTASLFPNIPELDEKEKLIINTKSPEYAVVDDRISFTFKLINSADNIFLLLSGSDKKKIADQFLNNNTEKKIPIQYIDRSDKTQVLLDMEMFK